MKNIFLNILFILFATNLLAQENVRATLDSTAILIGDQVGLSLSISQADAIQQPSVNLDPLKAVEKVEIINEGVWDTLNIMGNRVFQKEIILTSFDSGYYFIPSLVINYKKNGTNVSRATNKLALTVNTIPTGGAELDLAPIKPIIEEPLKFQDILPYLLAVLALLGIGFGFWKYRQGKTQEALPPPLPVIRPAHEIAFQKLEDLKSAKLWQQGKVKAYQSKLTHIVREYLENRFDIQALEQTSDQILRDLKRSDIEETHRHQLQEMFTMADLVKFAKAEPPVDANAKLMEYAEGFVRKTKKVLRDETKTSNE